MIKLRKNATKSASSLGMSKPVTTTEHFDSIRPYTMFCLSIIYINLSYNQLYVVHTPTHATQSIEHDLNNFLSGLDSWTICLGSGK
jgi:hypothetical protein